MSNVWGAVISFKCQQLLGREALRFVKRDEFSMILLNYTSNALPTWNEINRREVCAL